MRIDTLAGRVFVTFEVSYADREAERVCAYGDSLSEAVENLITRFKELQDAALDELHGHGFIRVTPREPKGDVS